MNLFEFILKLSFWQWVGVLCLAGIIFGSIASVFASIAERINTPK